jgi:predicted GNAT family acetyltransferase
MSEELRADDIDQIIYLIQWHFGETDHYAQRAAVEECTGYLVERDEDGKVLAYLIYEDDGRALHGQRSGVMSTERGKGLGLKLYKRMVKLAKKKGRAYQTYTSLNNVTSVNAHVRAGMRVTRISDFVYMST